MNLTFAILMWMIGLKLQMNNWYYIVICTGLLVHIYGIGRRDE